jgi:hypothetical protein
VQNAAYSLASKGVSCSKFAPPPPFSSWRNIKHMEYNGQVADGCRCNSRFRTADLTGDTTRKSERYVRIRDAEA